MITHRVRHTDYSYPFKPIGTNAHSPVNWFTEEPLSRSGIVHAMKRKKKKEREREREKITIELNE